MLQLRFFLPKIRIYFMILLEEYQKVDKSIGKKGPFLLYQYVNVLLQIKPTVLSADKYWTAVEFVSFREKNYIIYLKNHSFLGYKRIQFGEICHVCFINIDHTYIYPLAHSNHLANGYMQRNGIKYPVKLHLRNIWGLVY